MSKIQHVYFDVGGVLLLDFSGTNKWVELRRSLGVTEEHDEKFESLWKKYQDNICIDCDVDTLIPEFATELEISIPDGYSMLKDFVDRFDRNLSIWPVVQQIKTQCSIGLLTNMYPRMLGHIMKKQLLKDVEWDVVIDSSVVGFQKPDQQIFELAESLAGVKPEEIFFIDNTPQHIEAAANRGWATLLYHSQNPEESNQQIIEALDLSIDKSK